MTELQLKRWQSFSLRMAHRGYRLRRKSRKQLAGYVKDFFRILRHNYIGLPEPRHEGWLDRVEGWDQTRSHPTYRDSYGHSSNGPYITDIVSEMSEDWNPHYWSRDDRARQRWEDLWGSRISCCLRAGIDLAVSPSAGVMGFTAGDLRRMYRGNVPQWVTGGKKHRWTKKTFTGVVPGVGLVPGKDKLGETFAQMPDLTPVWL